MTEQTSEVKLDVSALNAAQTKPSWYGSNGEKLEIRNGASEFQSRDPIVEIQLQEKGKGKESHHGISVEHPTSFGETIMHLFKGNVGSGLFAMGDAVRNAGLLLAPGVIVFLGIVCVHSQHLLLNASKEMMRRSKLSSPPDFAETVEMCFATGPPTFRKLAPSMKKLVNLFLCITQLGFCCVYFVFISENFKQLADQYGYEMDVHIHMAIVFIPILLSCWVRNLKFLAPLSTIANILMLIGIVITLYFTTQDLPPIASRHYVSDLSKMPLFFGTALFAFEGIGLVLPLQNEMKKPKMFARPVGVLNIGMTVVTIIFASVGFLAYLKYGEEIKGSVTLNLPQDDPLAQTAKLVISLAILLTYALQFYIPIEIMWPNVSQTYGPFKWPVAAELAFRSFFVLLTFILAEAIPFLGLFISLVGAVSSTALALLFPPILELVTKWKLADNSVWLILKNYSILFIGALGCLTGTYESIHQIALAFGGGDSK